MGPTKYPLAVAPAKSPRTPLFPKGEGAQGFSYIEVLAALLIFTLGLFVVFGTITQLTRAAHSDKVKLKADLWARVLLDQVRAESHQTYFYDQSFPDRFRLTTIRDEENFPGFTATRDIAGVDVQGQRQVTVTIAGRMGGTTKDFVYQLVVGRNTSAPAGVTLRVKVVEASADGTTISPARPVIGATVQAPREDLPGEQMFQTTDTQGEAILRGVARSSATTITVYKAGLDPAPANPIQRIPLMGERIDRGRAQGYGWLNGRPDNQTQPLDTADQSLFPRGEIRMIPPIPLIPKGHVQGKVMDTGGVPISSITVRLYMNGPPYGVEDSTITRSDLNPAATERYFFEVKTDTAGVYVFNNVWPGEHRIWMRGRQGSHPTIPPSDGRFQQGYVRSFLAPPPSRTFIDVKPYNYQVGGDGTQIPTPQRDQLTRPTTQWNTERLGGLRVVLREAPLPSSPENKLWIPKPTGGSPSFPLGSSPILTVFGISDPKLLTPPVGLLPSDYLRDFPEIPNRPWWEGQLRRGRGELSYYKGIQYSLPLPVSSVGGRLRPTNPHEDFYNLFGVSMDMDNTGIQYDHFTYTPRDPGMRWLPLELREENACAPTIPEYIPSSVYFPDVPFHALLRPQMGGPGYTPITVYKDKRPAQQEVRIPLAKYSVWGSTITGKVVNALGGAPIQNARVAAQGCTIETDPFLVISTQTAADGTFTLRNALPSFTTPAFQSSPEGPDTDCVVDSSQTACWNANWRRLWVSGSSSARSVSVEGRVTDRQNGAGVSGATVTVQGASEVSAPTAPDGTYTIPNASVSSSQSETSFEGRNIAPSSAMVVPPLPSPIALATSPSPSGSATLIAQHLDYAPFSQTVSIPDSTFTLEWNASLSRWQVTVTGVVTRQQDGKPLVNKRIETVNNPYDVLTSTTTDQNGNFTLTVVYVTARGDGGPYYVTLRSPYGPGSYLGPDGISLIEGQYAERLATSSDFPTPSYTTTVRVTFQVEEAVGQ